MSGLSRVLTSSGTTKLDRLAQLQLPDSFRASSDRQRERVAERRLENVLFQMFLFESFLLITGHKTGNIRLFPGRCLHCTSTAAGTLTDNLNLKILWAQDLLAFNLQKTLLYRRRQKRNRPRLRRPARVTRKYAEAGRRRNTESWSDAVRRKGVELAGAAPLAGRLRGAGRPLSCAGIMQQK